MAYYGGSAFRELGRGVRGIGRGVADRRREDEATARQELEDERRREYEDLRLDMDLAEVGGGRGAAPTRTRDISGPAPPQTGGFEPGPLFPEPDRTPAGMDNFMPPPELEASPPSLELEEEDPRYRSLAGGAYHMMTPEARREQEFERGLSEDERLYGVRTGREEGERERFRSSVAPMIGRVASGELPPDHPEFGEVAAGGLSEGVDVLGYAPPGEFDPAADPTTARAQWMLERGYGPAGQVLPGPGGEPGAGGGGGMPSGFMLRQADAAIQLLESAGAIQQHMAAATDENQRRQLEARLNALVVSSPFNSIEEASSFVRTGQFDQPPPDLPAPGAGGEFPGITGGAPPPRDEIPRGGRSSEPLPDSEVQQIRQSLARFPRRQQEEMLREEGATEQQIMQILGGASPSHVDLPDVLPPSAWDF